MNRRELMIDHMTELTKSGNHYSGSPIPANIREGWEQARESGELTGCGLIDSMTMDEIDEIDEKNGNAMSAWCLLAGLNPVRPSYRDLANENSLLKQKVKQLEADGKRGTD